MAWNRSSNDGKAKTPVAQRRTRSVRPTVAAAAGVLVLAAAGVAWLLWPTGNSAAVSSKPLYRDGRIRDVAPAPAPKAAPSPKESDEAPQVDEKGRPLLTNIIKNVPGRRTPRPVRIIKHERIGPDGKVIEPPKPLFDAMSDNHLEQLVNYQPGESFVSIVEPADIARDFMVHVADKIEISPDDSPEDAARKEAYIKVREQILKDIRAGADLEQMIIEAKRTLQKIANMRNEYLNAIREAKAEGASDDDLDDLATAATMLLKEHGANPILSPRQEMKFWEEEMKEESEK